LVVRIALVILHADPARGGAERYTVDLAAALAGRGHEVTIVASSIGDVPASVQRVELQITGATRLSRYRSFLDRLDEHLQTHSYDIVHAMLPVRYCTVYHPHAGLAVEAIASGHRKYDSLLTRAISWLANRLNLKRNCFGKVERDLLTSDRPPIVLSLSEALKESVRRNYPQLPDRNLITLFNAVDLGKFDPFTRPESRRQLRHSLKIEEGELMALMIAQDFQRKGLRQAIDALARTRHAAARLTVSSGQPGRREIVLVVVGKGEVKQYAKLAAELGVEKQVIFAGPTSDPFAYYRAADFFVLPTRQDPCSLVVLEALAMGVPVISTRLNGACEIMAGGVHGFVLDDPSDVVALAQAMVRMTDSTFRRQAAQACLLLRPKLAYEHHLNTLEQAYAAAMV
jgi:UDP-glucose:(heptosyl)LPS alpha-1,3-glucosyltransferase